MTKHSHDKRERLRAFFALPLGLFGLMAVAPAARAAAAQDSVPGAAELETLLAALHVTDARQQITEVLHRYARGWDRRDEASLRSCFHADSTHQHGAYKGPSADFITAGLKGTANVRSMSHLITNVSIEVAGDRAVCECYFLSHHRRPRKDATGEEDWFMKGRYLDRFEKREGLWKIAHRRGLHDYARTFVPADTSLDAAPAEQLSGRKPEDPLYAMLAELHTPG